MKTTPEAIEIPKAFLLFLAVIALVNFVMVAPYLLAIFLGWIFATVLKPFNEFLIRKKWKQGHASLLSTLLAMFTIILPIAGLGFLTVKNLIKVVGPVAKDGINADAWVARIQTMPLASRAFESPEEIRAFFDEYSKKALTIVSNALTGFLGAAPELILQMVLALLATYFILRDGRKLREWMSPRVPLPTETKAHLSTALSETAYSSFVSMLVASIAQAIIVFVGFLVLKVPMAMLALGVAFVFAWFPIFGVAPVWLAACIYLIIDNRYGAAAGMAGFGALAGLSDNVIRPWVIQGRSDIHPLVSLVAIFGAIHFFGIIGVLVGPVLVSCLIEFLRVWPKFAERLGLQSETTAPKKATSP